MKLLFIREGFNDEYPFENLRLPSWVKDSRFETVSGDFSDDHLSQITNGVIVPCKPDVLAIPVFLGNPMNYSGIRLAMNVRLVETDEFIQPNILFIGSESKLEFLSHSPFSRFLRTQKVFYLEFCDEAIESFLDSFQPDLEPFVLNDNIQFMDVERPIEDTGHHNYDNKVTLLKWSEKIGCDEDAALFQVRTELQSSLHYKLMGWSSGIKESGNRWKKQFLEVRGRSRVLLIDDQEAHGWSVFFQKLFAPTPGIIFKRLPFDNKRLNSEDIIRQAQDLIENHSDGRSADVVILDLRLSENDMDLSLRPDELTGIQILDFIRDFNPGIQTIVFTASNKSWTLRAAFDRGVRNYVVKRVDGGHAFESLVYALKESFRKHGFLKTTYDSIQSMKQLVLNDEITPDHFKESASNALEFAFDLVEKSRVNESYLNYAFLHFFKIAEEWLNFYTHWNKEKEILSISPANGGDEIIVLQGEKSEIKWKEEGKKTFYSRENGKYSRHPTTDYKMSAMLIMMYGLRSSAQAIPGTKSSNWMEIRNVRNYKCGHKLNEKNGRVNLVKDDELKDLLNLLEYLFNVNNQKPVQSEVGA